MKRIRNFFEKNKVTLMLIPTAEKSVKQIKMNLAIAFGILAVLILINLGLLFSTVYSNYIASKLEGTNSVLHENLQMTRDRIASLESIARSKSMEVEKLTSTLKDTSDYLKTRLEDIDKAERYLVDLVTLFNKETKSKLTAPVSRSFVRNAEEGEEGEESERRLLLSEQDRIIHEMATLTQSDEISDLLKEKQEEYSALEKTLLSQLTYLEARPDFMPAKGTITSKFGYRPDPVNPRRGYSFHNAIDIADKYGSGIHAAGSGIVKFAGTRRSYGNVVIIDHGYGYETVYAHNSELLVKKGQKVSKGEKIAKMGRSGYATGVHLHFEIRFNGTAVDPMNFVGK